MHDLLLLAHSVFRYFALIFLIVLIIRSLMGWMNKSAFASLDEKFSLWLFIVAHTQLLLGLVLYFISPVVIFSAASMKDSVARYWLVEHLSIMLIAIILITVARISIKKISDGAAKYKRLFIYNFIALILILVAILQSGRGFFSIHGY
jgi:hypothetical protein